MSLMQKALELGERMCDREVPVSLVGSVAASLFNPSICPNDIDFLIEGREWEQVVNQVFKDAGFVALDRWRQCFVKQNYYGKRIVVDVFYKKKGVLPSHTAKKYSEKKVN